ncbi:MULTISPECIES: NAD(+) diphosphatase [Brevundimonas]|uniref:NAD(+) diphosphatase n=1 Tax=Brevundimonas TaxID=41275 RepID=UPI001903E1F3|nr:MULTISPECIES: NAD(+) diphosphatase [Brevundimonas]MBK1968692.1 NAD(+) diphosphatase [Brevundimonas diminuta]MBK1974196.1 NAD(+) diphosphatase [Brevundimonas diminuta]MDA0744841.1 NAD(+) diphosphatase [Pseudomonadota bacterium]MDM8353294.1 NAD(+) diphosphatase [Brevundimonas diminuta]
MSHRNVFSGNPLDRSGDLRNDAAWLAEQETNPEALAMILWEGRPLIETHEGAERLVWLSLGHARDLARDRDVFLGLWKGAPVFAAEFEGSIDPTSGPAGGLGRFVEMREAAVVLPEADAGIAATAKSLFDWRRRHGFCAACGKATDQASGGWKRVCPACGTEHFPRVDPVVIMLPVYKCGAEPRCLLGRQAAWPAGRMSALAGFMEPGEAIEEACAREVMEEAGLTVCDVRYHSSQPWPFPAQLMIGLIAEVTTDEAAPDQTELEAVAWLTRSEARAVLDETHPTIHAPPPYAIARRLLESWAAE